MKSKASSEKKEKASVMCYCIENMYVCQIHPAPFTLADNPRGNKPLVLLSADGVIPLVVTGGSEAGVPGVPPRPCSPAQRGVLQWL